MPREFAKTWFSMFTDEDFVSQPNFDKLLYVALLAQPSLNYAGVLPLNFKRLAKAMREGVQDVAELVIKGALNRLEERRYVFTDPETGEVLIRSLMRRDEVWRQPFVFVSALHSVAAVESPKLAAVLLEELERIDFPQSSNEKLKNSLSKAEAAAFGHARPLAKGSPRPSPRPFPEVVETDDLRPSERPSPRPSVVVEVGVVNSPSEVTQVLKKTPAFSYVSNATRERETAVALNGTSHSIETHSIVSAYARHIGGMDNRTFNEVAIEVECAVHGGIPRERIEAGLKDWHESDRRYPSQIRHFIHKPSKAVAISKTTEAIKQNRGIADQLIELKNQQETAL